MSSAVARERSCRLLSWKPWDRPGSSLLGHCSVSFQGGWCIHDVPIFVRGDGSLSAGTPSMPELGADGTVRVKADGKKAYHPIVTFETAEGRARWNRLILGALAAGGITGASGGGLYRLELPPC
jgi:hypothetical protein